MFRLSPPTQLRFAAASALACLVGFLPATSVRAGGPSLPPEQDPLIQNMDTSVSPGTDFFQYACGKWLKANPIPASERGWGIANLVNEETYRQRLTICESAAGPAPRRAPASKIGRASCRERV